MANDPLELLLNRTWRPMLSYTGQAGLPDLVQGGNVLRPKTSLKLSLRVPPTLDATNLDRQAEGAARKRSAVRRARHVRAGERRRRMGSAESRSRGSRSRSTRASQTFFGKPATTWGEGGSIPFMGMLGAALSRTRSSSSPASSGRTATRTDRTSSSTSRRAKNVTACVAQVLADERTRATVARYAWPPAYFFSPASMRIGSRFCGGGSGHVAYGVNAHGGL